MGQNFRLSLKNLGKSVISRNLPYPFLRGQSLNIFYGDSILKQQRHFQYLGVVVDESLSWNNHVSYVASRVYPKLKLLSRTSSFLSPEILLKIYKTQFYLSIRDYGCIVWGFCSKKNSDFLERLQNKAMQIILRTNHLACTQSMRERLGLLTLSNRRRYLRLQLVYKIVNDYHCPRQLQGYFALRSQLRRKIKPSEIVGSFISQDKKQLWASQHSSMPLQRNGMTSPKNCVFVKR